MINSDHAHDSDHDRMRRSRVFDLQGRINVSDITYKHEVEVSGILQERALAVSSAHTAIALKYASKRGCVPTEFALRAQLMQDLRTQRFTTKVKGQFMCDRPILKVVICKKGTPAKRWFNAHRIVP